MRFHSAKEQIRYDQLMTVDVVRTEAQGIWIDGNLLLLHLGADGSTQFVKIHDRYTLTYITLFCMGIIF